MAYGDIGTVIDSLEFAAEDISHPKIVHVSGDIYAIAYVAADGTGKICTVDIDAAGSIPATIVASAVFEAATANGIFFMHITGNVFAVLTRIDYTDLRLRTVSISDDGLTITNIDFGTVGAPNSDYFSMCLARGEIYAVAYSEAGTQDGWVKTFTISDAGAISAALSSFEFDGAAADFCVIINVSTDVCAIAYTQSAGTKLVTTISVDGDGVIADIAGGPLTITTTSKWATLDFCRAKDNVFVVAWPAADNDGWITSLLIDGDGVMTDPGKADLEYNETDASWEHVIAIGLGLCALVYNTSGDDGRINTFEVDEDGNISEPSVHSYVFDGTTGRMPHIVHVAGDVYAIAYRGVDFDGWLKSLDVSTPPVGGVSSHLTLMGIG